MFDLYFKIVHINTTLSHSSFFLNTKYYSCTYKIRMKLNFICLSRLSKDFCLKETGAATGGPQLSLLHLYKEKNAWRMRSGSAVNQVSEPQVVEAGLYVCFLAAVWEVS